MEKYDVFISCKSEDYKYAEEVYDYLVNEGIKTFLASKELRELGESEYRHAIEDAMDQTSHIIVFASDADYVRSKWVRYEWDMFVNDKLSDIKQGNLVTILKDVEIRALPIGLRKYQSFTFDDYKNSILKYVETEESIERRKEIQKKKEEERLKLEEEKKKEEEKTILREQLKDIVISFQKSLASLKIDEDNIHRILKKLDITEKTCPICSLKVSIEVEACPQCGWPFTPLTGIEEIAEFGVQNPKVNEVYKKIYTEKVSSVNKDTRQKSNISKKEVEENVKPNNGLPNNASQNKSSNYKGSQTQNDSHNKSRTQNNTINKNANLTIKIDQKNIELKRVLGPKGVFYITYEELPSWISAQRQKKELGRLYGNIFKTFFSQQEARKVTNEEYGPLHLKVREFIDLLSYLTSITGYVWSLPTPEEWIEAYEAQAFIRHDPKKKEWCENRKENYYVIQDPTFYCEVGCNYGSFPIHPVIRVKDNPKLK